MSTQYTSLLAWATARGAVWSTALEVRDTGPRGRGVFSAGAGLKKGDVILRLPLSLAVRPSGHLRELCAENKITNVMALALIIVHELFADPSSRDPFFELLAASASPAVPLLWDRSTLHLLHGTALMGPTASLPSAALGGAGAKPGGGPPSNVAGADAALAAAREAFATDVLPAMALAGEEYLPTHVRTMRHFETALAWVTSRGLQGRLNYEVPRLMGKVNFPTIEDAVRRLGVADGECVVELGAGDGVGVRALAAAGRKGLDVWAVEISARFRATLLATTALSPSRVVDADAKAMPFLASGSVDKVLAVNVVYFLDPLPVYLEELHRVLRPKTGVLLFACKFNLQVQPAVAPCVNVALAPVVAAMKEAGFEVSVEEVDLSGLGNAKYSYIAVKGRKL